MRDAFKLRQAISDVNEVLLTRVEEGEIMDADASTQREEKYKKMENTTRTSNFPAASWSHILKPGDARDDVDIFTVIVYACTRCEGGV